MKNVIMCIFVIITEEFKNKIQDQAKEKQAEYHGNQYDNKSGITPKLVEVHNNHTNNETNSKLTKWLVLEQE